MRKVHCHILVIKYLHNAPNGTAAYAGVAYVTAEPARAPYSRCAGTCVTLLAHAQKRSQTAMRALGAMRGAKKRPA